MASGTQRSPQTCAAALERRRVDRGRGGLWRAVLPVDRVAQAGALEHLEGEQRALHARGGEERARAGEGGKERGGERGGAGRGRPTPPPLPSPLGPRRRSSRRPPG